MTMADRLFALSTVTRQVALKVPVLVLLALLHPSSCTKDSPAVDIGSADAVIDAPRSEVALPDGGAGDGAGDDVVSVAPVKPFRELLGGEITEKVRFVFDKAYEGEVDVDRLKEYVLSRSLREADEFSALTAAEHWWEDYQDVADILYYSAEYVFSEQAPYPGQVFMPHIWDDVIYRVSDVTVEFVDLSKFYAAVDTRKIKVTEPAGTEWTLLAAMDGIAWANEEYTFDPNEMVVVVTRNEKYKDADYSYYFVEEQYAEQRGFDAHYFNTIFNEWPTDMQEAEGLKPHDVPIWMHFAFLNGEWDEATSKWRLFPGFRWGGYEGANIYFIEGIKDFYKPVEQCEDPPEHPQSHFYNDEMEHKKCLDVTGRLEYDWYRLWRHAFNVPSFPFWWSEKVDVRVVVIDLRDYVDGKPEYEESEVIDWTTVEDAVKEANPFANLTIQRYYYTPPDEIKQILIENLIKKAGYPLHSEVKLMDTDGEFDSFHMDWHYHFDISGLPGMQVYIAELLAAYFGGVDSSGKPAQYNPFADPYHITGQPFVIPGLFFLTPFNSYEGRVGGWTTNTGDLMCIFANQLGQTCEELHIFFDDLFGQPVGPNVMAWSDAYCVWWEIFIVDWTYATSPVNTLRWFLDAEPFMEMLLAIPEVGTMFAAIAPFLFDEMFGPFHPWASGFPFWLKESLTDDSARELTRQFTSYQYAESIQHNIGYKHQTTVIFDSPYLGMEDGFDYRKHKDLKETFLMTDEQISMPFYSTEPGSRDFVVDANSYMTHKMGAGTRHMLHRIFARREVVALYDLVTAIDAAHELEDVDYQDALKSYSFAAAHALEWRHEQAYFEALKGLEAVDRYWTGKGEPDKLHTDWDSKVEFAPDQIGMDVDPAVLSAKLKSIGGEPTGK